MAFRSATTLAYILLHIGLPCGPVGISLYHRYVENSLPLLISGFITFSVPWVRGQDPETGDGPKVQSDLPAIIDDIVYINNDCFNAYHVFVITRYTTHSNVECLTIQPTLTRHYILRPISKQHS